MLLLLMRHGPAVDRNLFEGPDAARPLTPEGRQKTRLACRGLLAQLGRLDRLAASPAVRTLKTATILRAELARVPAAPADKITTLRRPVALTLETWPELMAADLGPLCERLREVRDGTVVCVGHEPLLSQLAARLLCGSEDCLEIRLKKCGVVALEIDWESGGGALLWHLAPAQLRRLAS